MIKHKEKPCKGINKAFGYKGCGKPTLSRRNGLCMNCFPDWVLNTEQGQIHMHKAMMIGKKDVEKKVKIEEKEQRVKLTKWNEKLQEKINEIVRLIDKGLPCLARGYVPKQTHAGHVYARGGNQTIKFNLHNIHRQSAQSNHFQNDDGLLREGLIKEYGQEYFNFIYELRQTQSLKYNNDEYHEFYKLASKIALHLKKENLTYDLTKRIVLRNEINLKLGIYDDEFCVFIPF
jgi:hypothetical protein